MPKLGDIANIQFGPFEKGQAQGELKYLHASHFDVHYQPSLFKESFIPLTEKSERFILQENEVILSGKGLRIFAWAYDGSWGKVVPSSLFYILKLKTKAIKGDYLAHWLNSAKTQHQLKLMSAGASVPSLPKKELQALEVPLPTILQQQQIIQLAHLLNKDIQLQEELLNQKKQLKKGLLNDILNKIETTKKASKS